MQPALSTTERGILFVLAAAAAACGGKGGLHMAGGDTGGMGGVTTTGGMTTASGGVSGQGGGVATGQDGGASDSAFMESPDSSGNDSGVGVDAGAGCPPEPTIFPQYQSQLLTDPATGCVLSVFYTNSDAGVSCPPLDLPSTLCLSSLLPVTDPATGCATGFRCAYPTDCALGAGCPTTDAGVACPPLPFPSEFCTVLLTVVDPTTGCVRGFTCKGIPP
jgi:hypothetical protein